MHMAGCIHTHTHTLIHADSLFAEPLPSRTRKHTQVHVQGAISLIHVTNGCGRCMRICDSAKVTLSKVHLRGPQGQALRDLPLQRTPANMQQECAPSGCVALCALKGQTGIAASSVQRGRLRTERPAVFPDSQSQYVAKTIGLTQALTFVPFSFQTPLLSRITTGEQ